MKKKLVNNFENFSLMDLELWEYIFEMFNYKIRQKKIDFFKITNPYPALNEISFWVWIKKSETEKLKNA